MIVGIDLGTTNSLVAVWADGEARIIPNALGEPITPSVIGFDDNGDVLVGRAAKDRLITHPDLSVSAFKRYMGTNRETRLGKRSFRPEELSSLVLRSLKADAEAYLGTPVTEAVISVPAYFNDTQRKATRLAGQLAGFHVERLINEPTAAALAFGLRSRDIESKFLVFDLGGGTFDVSVIELFEGVIEVRASAGDNYLGGEDFVDALVDAFLGKARESLGEKFTAPEGKIMQILRDQAERAKRAITKREEAEIKAQLEGNDIALPVDDITFNEISAPLLARLTAPVERALRDAKFRPSDLNEVLLVGGATRMPVVQKMAARMFGRLPARHVNPDEAIALGAAVQAGLKARDEALDDVVMTDVAPYTLGVEMSQVLGKNNFHHGWFMPVIERNSAIPISRMKTLYTLQDNQHVMEIKIFQGESRRVKDNIFLGEISINLPRNKAGEEQVEIRFTYDVNGILEVAATSPTTGRSRRVVIEQNPGILTEKEIAERLKALADLKIHPRDKAENRATLTRAERIYEELLGDARDWMAELILRFEAVIERQDPAEIDESRKRFKDIMDEIEGDPFF